MVKKRNTRKKYGGQSAFEMGMASYVRHLLDYTDGGGNWTVDLDGFTLPDGTQPTARWITNRIIHNYQKGSGGSDFFGKRFEYSPKAVSFLASILHQIKRHFSDENVDSEEEEEGIYNRESFSSYVDDAIKIIDSKIAEKTEPSSKISRASTNMFDSLPIETLAKKPKEPKVKVTMTPAVLTRMVEEKTTELLNKSQSDNITIGDLRSKVAELTIQNNTLSRKVQETEQQNKKLDSELVKLKPVVVKPEVEATKVVPKRKPEVEAPKVVSKPEVEATKVVAPEVEATEVEATKVVSGSEVLPPPPPLSEADKAEADKKALMEKRRAEIAAKVAEGRKQQKEEEEKREKLKSAMSFLAKPKARSRKDILGDMFVHPPKFTYDEIERLGKKLHLNPLGVKLFINISSKSEDPENAVFLENILAKKTITEDYETKLDVLLNSVEIKEGTETIDMFKTIMKFILKTWLSDLWPVDDTLVNKYKIDSFEKTVSIFESLFTDLQNYRKSQTPEYDSHVRNLLDKQFDESRDDMFNNCIAHNWGVFGVLFVLDKGNRYKTFADNMKFYEEHTTLGDKGIFPIQSMIKVFEKDSYNTFSENMIHIFNTIEEMIVLLDKYLSKPDSKKPDIGGLRNIYSTFIENGIMFSIFLIFDSYKGNKGKNIMSHAEKLSNKFIEFIKKWDEKLSRTENPEYKEYMLFIFTFSISIIKMIKYALIPVELQTRLEISKIQYSKPPADSSGEPPGGGYTLTSNKNKKKGGRRRTQKKHYRK